MRGRNRQIKIPDEFDILGFRIYVKKVPDVYHIPDVDVQTKDTIGAYLDSQKTIYLVTNGQSKQTIEHTFFHELGHCIMEHIGREDLDEDEAFLDSLGACLHQFLKTTKQSKETKLGLK